MKRSGTRSPDEPPVARMRGRWRHPGAFLRVAALMRATGVLEAMGEGKKERPISSYAIALPLWGRVGEGGSPESSARGLPPSLSLPRKGGGNALQMGLPWTR
jgi:hypothetical protein